MDNALRPIRPASVGLTKSRAKSRTLTCPKNKLSVIGLLLHACRPGFLCGVKKKGLPLATGIQTGMRPGSSNRRSSRFARISKFIAPYKNLIFLLLCVTAILWLHLGASPWERALGLAHGDLVTTPKTNFLVFDHLTPSGQETLNRNLFHHTSGDSKIVTVSGYGLWRFGLLMGLAYAFFLCLVQNLKHLRPAALLRSGLKATHQHLVLFSLILGVGAGLLGADNFAVTLFALAYLRAVVVVNKTRPDPSKVAGAIELLDLARALWSGWLIPKLLLTATPISADLSLPFAGLLGGIIASYLFLIGLRTWPGKLLNGQQVRSSCKLSFEMGCWESLAVLSLGVLSFKLGVSYFAGSLAIAGAYGFGRIAQVFLLRRVVFLESCGASGKRESALRIASGVWFLLPTVAGDFFQGHDQTALMIWLAVLSPLVVGGRPWGSSKNVEAHPLEIQPAPPQTPEKETPESLRPVQKSAILFMSLPPELSAQLFAELGPAEVQAVTLEITQLPRISPETRKAVIQEFFDNARGSGNPTRCSSSTKELETQVRNDLGKTADFIRKLHSEEHPNRPKLRVKKQHVCTQCGTRFNHGIGLRKHQKQAGHKGSAIEEFKSCD